MAGRSEILDYLVDQLASLGDARGRALFGGHGLYVDGLIIGIIAFDTFYLKVDGDNRADFEAAGSTPFTYDGKEKPIVMPYWECPADVMEDPDRLRAWALKSLAAARRSRKPPAGKAGTRKREPKRRRRRTQPSD